MSTGCHLNILPSFDLYKPAHMRKPKIWFVLANISHKVDGYIARHKYIPRLPSKEISIFKANFPF